ncbi:YqaJ viral recombinase family protein [Bosea sp. SSUT16]|uniref:YqaJ viral recombinase family protein n=1 Tax=Bosea spartocytisi TaxID=2773451 RepID=A0A927HWD6_9HYPH|nr:lambda exonuclease family protein [Bosea spartocytisi]MBD3844240.1 YqaJ viral recombinase family protein [Bosea spartocytisi]MCT4470653.1 YqaJ viral recombinase family protein [Bosea spartocytisi]
MDELVQGSPEWLAIRVGKVTASRVADVVAKTKTGYGASRANYMAELIAERLTGAPAERYTNAAMAWGTEKEPEARALYEFLTDAEVTQVGFVPHPTISDSGASPDGLVGEDGLVEIKCPNTATHIDTLLGRSIPAKYETQMQWQMACTGRLWCDFVSYDPRMPDSMRLFVCREERNDAMIAELAEEVGKFLVELDAKVASLTALYERKEAA